MSTALVPAVIMAAIQEQQLNEADVNLMLPSETFGQVLGEYDKVTMEVVRVDPNPAAGDVYEIEGRLALGKVPLQKIATALSIVWDPEHTGIVEDTPTKARAKATGAMRKPNGEWVVVTREKTVDLSADEETLRLKYEEDADKGNFTGKVTDWGTSKNGKKYPAAFEPWKSEQEKLAAIDRAVRKALLQKRKFKNELADTGAMDRVIRAFIGVKTYTAADLARPFAFPRVTTDTSKLLADPQMRATAIAQMHGSVKAIFGTPTREAEDIERDVTPLPPQIEAPEDESLEEGDDFETAPEPEDQTGEQPEDERWTGIIEYEAAFKLPKEAIDEIAKARAKGAEITDEDLASLTARVGRWCDKHEGARR